ncbi:MAG: DUF421 domain-containing protein [Firmicutes bacterium]|nr:DUF421 domain-containing protein [Bacillota bacterium]
MKEWVEILLRTIILFFVTLGLVKIRGKKHPTKMTAFDYISYGVIIILVTLTSVKIIENWVFGVIALMVWSLFPVGLDYLSMKSKMLYEFIHGKETVLIKNGKILEENISKLKMTGEDLLRELRTKNVFSLADVEFAMLETTGDVNVLLKSDKKPITAKDLGEKVSMSKESQTIILDGNIIDEALFNAGLNRDWVGTQLNGMGISIDNVFIGQVDSSGDLFVDLFDDSIQHPQPKVKDLLYANLQKVHADLITYSLETENSIAKEMYLKNIKKIDKMIKKLKPYLIN